MAGEVKAVMTIAPDRIKTVRTETYQSASRPWREIIEILLGRKLSGKIIINASQGTVGSIQWEENGK